MGHKSYITLFTVVLITATLSCKSPKDSNKGIEYISEPITEVQTHSEKNVVPDQKQRVKGEWIILKASGKEINSLDERAYINFSPKEDKIYGFTGCNYINGKYEVSNENSIRFSDIITTAKHCDAVRDENNILNGLNTAMTFVVYRKDGLFYLDLKDSNGKTVVHMKHHNADVLTGTWEVTSIYEHAITENKPQLVIDIPELKLHGNLGCNIINGNIGLDRNKDWFVQFQRIVSTKRNCEEKFMDIERDLLVALEEVEYIDRTNYENIILRDKNRNNIISLKRIEIKVEK